MSAYIPILLFILVAVSFPIITILIAKLVQAGRHDPVKAEPYECGIKPTSEAHDTRFSVRYYLIAVLFVVFDVETVFLYPWAVNFKALGWFGYMEMLVFAVTLVIGLAYVWKKGALDWES